MSVFASTVAAALVGSNRLRYSAISSFRPLPPPGRMPGCAHDNSIAQNTRLGDSRRRYDPLRTVSGGGRPIGRRDVGPQSKDNGGDGGIGEVVRVTAERRIDHSADSPGRHALDQCRRRGGGMPRTSCCCGFTTGRPVAAASVFPFDRDLCHELCSLSRTAKLVARDHDRSLWARNRLGSNFRMCPTARHQPGDLHAAPRAK